MAQLRVDEKNFVGNPPSARLIVEEFEFTKAESRRFADPAGFFPAGSNFCRPRPPCLTLAVGDSLNAPGQRT